MEHRRISSSNNPSSQTIITTDSSNPVPNRNAQREQEGSARVLQQAVPSEELFASRIIDTDHDFVGVPVPRTSRGQEGESERVSQASQQQSQSASTATFDFDRFHLELAETKHYLAELNRESYRRSEGEPPLPGIPYRHNQDSISEIADTVTSACTWESFLKACQNTLEGITHIRLSDFKQL